MKWWTVLGDKFATVSNIKHDGRNYVGKAFAMKIGEKYTCVYLFEPYGINWGYNIGKEDGNVLARKVYENDSKEVKEIRRLIKKAAKIEYDKKLEEFEKDHVIEEIYDDLVENFL